MFYIPPESLDRIFGLVRDAFTTREQVPEYKEEQLGVEELCGVLRMAQADEFYPNLLTKATYLFISINKGHFFSNGNKRLALVCATLFLAINEHELSVLHSKSEHREKLQSLFPTFNAFEDDDRFFPEEFGLYNLSIIVAESQTYTNGNFDTLKTAVRNYFAFAIDPPHSGRLEIFSH